MNESDRAWVAGFLEGEGSFYRSKRDDDLWVSCGSTDRDVLERLQSFIGGKIYMGGKPKKEHHKQLYMFHLYGPKTEALMREVLPLMGQRRAAKIHEILRDPTYKGGPYKDEPEEWI